MNIVHLQNLGGLKGVPSLLFLLNIYVTASLGFGKPVIAGELLF